MKPVLFFMMKTCPYCQQAIAWLEELKNESPKYREVEIEMIDEKVHPEIADKYDYYYVPTFYVDGVKVHEGAAEKEDIRRVLETACR